jgi:hypothetical protein
MLGHLGVVTPACRLDLRCDGLAAHLVGAAIFLPDLDACLDRRAHGIADARGQHGSEQASRALVLRAHGIADRRVDVLAQGLTLLRHSLQPLPELRDVRGRAILGQIHHEQRDQPVDIGLGPGVQALPLDPRHCVALGERLEDRGAAFGQRFFLGQPVDRVAPAGVLSRGRRR